MYRPVLQSLKKLMRIKQLLQKCMIMYRPACVKMRIKITEKMCDYV